jgi:hypothetical protein
MNSIVLYFRGSLIFSSIIHGNLFPTRYIKYPLELCRAVRHHGPMPIVPWLPQGYDVRAQGKSALVAQFCGQAKALIVF